MFIVSYVFLLSNFGSGSSSALLPLETLQPVWLTPEVYCIIPVFLIVPTLAAACLSRPQPAVAPLAATGGTMEIDNAANLRHGTDNFTSLPKEGVLRIFIAL
jgi:hypothetical protein